MPGPVVGRGDMALNETDTPLLLGNSKIRKNINEAHRGGSQELWAHMRGPSPDLGSGRLPRGGDAVLRDKKLPEQRGAGGNHSWWREWQMCKPWGVRVVVFSGKRKEDGEAGGLG